MMSLRIICYDLRIIFHWRRRNGCPLVDEASPLRPWTEPFRLVAAKQASKLFSALWHGRNAGEAPVDELQDAKACYL